MGEDIDPFKILNLPEEDVSQAAIDKVCAQVPECVVFRSAAVPAVLTKQYHRSFSLNVLINCKCDCCTVCIHFATHHRALASRSFAVVALQQSDLTSTVPCRHLRYWLLSIILTRIRTRGLRRRSSAFNSQRKCCWTRTRKLPCCASKGTWPPAHAILDNFCCC